MSKNRAVEVCKVLDLATQHMRTFPFAAAIADPKQEDCPIVWVNDKFIKLTGYGYHQVLGRNCRFLQKPESKGRPDIRQAIDARQEIDTYIENVTADGQVFTNHLLMMPIKIGEIELIASSQLNARNRDYKPLDVKQKYMPDKANILRRLSNDIDINRSRTLKTWGEIFQTELKLASRASPDQVDLL